MAQHVADEGLSTCVKSTSRLMWTRRLTADFLAVDLPLVRPILAVVLLSFIGTFNEFVWRA
jgi:hypothetical protein